MLAAIVESNLHRKTTLFCIEISKYGNKQTDRSVLDILDYNVQHREIFGESYQMRVHICLINTWTFAGFVIFHVIKKMIHPGEKAYLVFRILMNLAISGKILEIMMLIMEKL